MKKVIMIIAISIGCLGCAAAGYVFGCKTAETLAKEEAIRIESDYKIQIDNYENSIKDYEKQIKSLKDKQDTSSKQDKGSKGQETQLGAVQVNDGYEYVDFELVFGPFCTEDNLSTIKNEVARAISESEYKNIKQAICSEYFNVDSEKGKVQTYARLDDKGVLEITYSIRYGTPSAVISDYSQTELSELEKYGRVMDIDSTETVTPYPENREG